jgi:folylpolyglutamate synthase/dihydropteroate synthase
MRRERIETDQAFFAERVAGRGGGQRRSLRRARALAPHLGVALDAWSAHPERVVTVVGSKGKGTAATFASAALAAAGLRVGTLTSPGLRSNRERIRVDGLAVPPRDYDALVGEVAATLARVSDLLPDDGYLSPSGLFTLSALRHFADRGCEAVVLEAGMGGAVRRGLAGRARCGGGDPHPLRAHRGPG